MSLIDTIVAFVAAPFRGSPAPDAPAPEVPSFVSTAATRATARAAEAPSTTSQLAPISAVTTLKGRRVTSEEGFFSFQTGFQSIVPPDSTLEQWRVISLDARTIRGLDANRLLRILAEVSPDVSRALWDFLRLCNPGWEFTVTKPGSMTPSKEGKRVVDEWLARLRLSYGAVDIPIGKLHFAAFLRGALFAELVLDEQGRVPLDLATPDPISVRFKTRKDPNRGQVWEFGQLQLGKFVSLEDRVTIKYLPIDPAPGVAPYGRSPAAPALFTSLFLLGMLHDLRRVIAAQGYPRYDLVLNLQALLPLIPPDVFGDKKQLKVWVDAFILEIAEAYDALEPDAAFVHTDSIVVNAPKGAISSDALGAVDGLIKALERMLARALKTMPLLFGMLEGASEANATRQWELQAASIKSVQHLSETLLGDLATLACEAEGVAAQVRWTFAELRAAELYRDAMTEGMKTDTATKQWGMGWSSQEQASMAATGHLPDQAEPRFIPKGMVSIEEARSAGDASAGDGTGKKGDNSTPADDNNNDPAARILPIWAPEPVMPNGHSKP